MKNQPLSLGIDPGHDELDELYFGKDPHQKRAKHSDWKANSADYQSFLESGQAYQKRAVTVVTDSKYLFNLLVNGWIKNWSDNNGTKSAGKPVKNP